VKVSYCAWASQSALKAGAAADPLRAAGLAPHARYDVEIDDQELWEEETDAGGTLMLALPEGTDAGVRIRRRAD
jgi:hypothetical protein